MLQSWLTEQLQTPSPQKDFFFCGDLISLVFKLLLLRKLKWFSTHLLTTKQDVYRS